jgi:uncharacterized surface protein with fasciclin (FAS1) repeats
MNLPKFLSFINRALLAFAVVAVVGISACDDDEPDGPTIYDGTVMELIQSDEFKQSEGAAATEALDSLVKYIKAYGLEATVNNTANITLFAPSNQAFVNLLTTTPGFPSNIKSISSNIIAGVLAYHVVPQVKKKADLTSGTVMNTLFTQPDNCNPASAGVVQVITVNANGTLFTGSTNEEIEILSADHEAETGVVHVVESVMIPPTVGASLEPLLTSVAGPVFLSSNFSLMAGLITYADCGTTGQVPIANILGNPEGNMTVFLPPNAVLGPKYGTTVAAVLASLATEGITTPAQLRGFLLGHVIASDEYTAAELTAATGTNIAAANGQNIGISLNGSTVLLNGSVAVVGPDADATRLNGIVHAVSDFIGL